MTDLLFSAVQIGSILLDLAVALAILLVPIGPARSNGGPRPIRLWRIGFAGLVLTLLLPPKVIMLRRIGLDFFGAVNLVYLDLVIVLPLCGLVVLWVGRRRRRTMARWRGTSWVRLAALLSLLAMPIGVFATFIEPYRTQLEEADVHIGAARMTGSSVRVGVLADIQTDRITSHEWHAVEQVMDWQPDMILLPGDLFQGNGEDLERELPALTELLSRLHAPGGVYAVLGNIDPRELARLAFDNTSVRMLDNELVSVDVNGNRLLVGGIGWPHDTPQAQRTIARLEHADDRHAIRILLSHAPDAVLGLPRDSNIDLVVAGHTHGGQVQLPLFGPLLTATRVPREVAGGGLHVLNGNRVYVSRGVGWERGQAPRIRFLCPPEVSLLSLRP